ncbi:restriction endonuclease subunit S [Vibrio vulnificus]|nr:restriction endonuclease subunit S [Vibrio vulnificus]
MTGRYKVYPEYKKSSIDWVGDIPSTWLVKPTFSVFEPSVNKNTDGRETTVLSLSYGNIIERNVETNFGLLPESFNTYQIVDNGDLILRLTDLQNDKKSLRVGLVKQKGIITSAYLKLGVTKSIEPRFAYRLLHSYDTTKVFYGMGGGLRQSMKFEDFRRLPIVLPPYEEQQKIANFLDHETAKIDTLIAKQEKLIELLKEKRQAVISHVVTKGLNPHAPMKDSGVELLGEVPEHWELSKLRFMSSFGRGLGITKANLHETGVPCVSYGEVHSKYGFEVNADKHALKCVSEAYLENNPECLLSEGDIIFADTSEDQDGAGNFTQISGSQRIFAGYHTVVVKLSFEIYKRFMAYVFDSESFRNQIRTSVKGVKVFSVTQAILKNSTIWLPPVKEQKAITEHLDNITSKIDRLISNQNKAIKLMRERKIALISAAVTGKIDVRDWQGEA